MIYYQIYINALRKCAKEHMYDTNPIGHIRISDLCKDTANLLEKLEQESCEDAVSRQTVKEQMIKYGFHAPDMTVAEFVEDLQPVNPQPKTGHWIIEKWNNKEHYSCSSCQHVVDYEPCYHYCPYCGAKMIDPQESEEEDESYYYSHK